jgi:hypothetical protein
MVSRVCMCARACGWVCEQVGGQRVRVVGRWVGGCGCGCGCRRVGGWVGVWVCGWIIGCVRACRWVGGWRVRVRVRVRVRTRVSVSVEQVHTFWAPLQLLRGMETSSRSCRERPGMPSCSLLRTFCVKKKTIWRKIKSFWAVRNRTKHKQKTKQKCLKQQSIQAPTRWAWMERVLQGAHAGGAH